jgi:hypothetical protein
MPVRRYMPCWVSGCATITEEYEQHYEQFGSRYAVGDGNFPVVTVADQRRCKSGIDGCVDQSPGNSYHSV